jgi:hypothetical protein
MFKPMFTLNNLKFKGEGAEIFSSMLLRQIQLKKIEPHHRWLRFGLLRQLLPPFHFI